MAHDLSSTASEALFDDDPSILDDTTNHDFSSMEMLAEHLLSGPVPSCQHNFLPSPGPHGDEGTNLEFFQLFMDPVPETDPNEDLSSYRLSASDSLVSATHDATPTFAKKVSTIATVTDELPLHVPCSEPPNLAPMSHLSEYTHVESENNLESNSRQEATRRRQQLAARRMLKRAARHNIPNFPDFAMNVTSRPHTPSVHNYSGAPEKPFTPSSPTFITPGFNNSTCDSTDPKNTLQLNGRLRKESRRPTSALKNVSCIRTPCILLFLLLTHQPSLSFVQF